MTKLSLSWNEIREGARKIAHNSVVKIEATTGRDEHIKVWKSSGTAHTIIRLGSISIDGAYSKVEQPNSKGEWDALTSFDKNREIRRGGKVQELR